MLGGLKASVVDWSEGSAFSKVKSTLKGFLSETGGREIDIILVLNTSMLEDNVTFPPVFADKLNRDWFGIFGELFRSLAPNRMFDNGE